MQTQVDYSELPFRDPSLVMMSSWADYRSFARQVRILTGANLKARYRKTVAGFIWVVINPLIMFGAQALVFKVFLRLNIPNYALFLLSGLLPWVFAIQCLDMCASIFVNSAQLLKSFQVNPLVYLVAQIADNAVNFIAAFLLLLVPVWIANPQKAIGLILLPLPLIVLTLGVFGLSWLAAITHVFFRDTRFIIQFISNVGFYLTPIFYSAAFIPRGFLWILPINPFYQLLDPFRVALVSFSWGGFARSMAGALITAALTVTAAWLLWRRKRNAVYFNI